MTTLCMVDGLEATYHLTSEIDGSKKCSIVFKSTKNKLDLEVVAAGEGAIYIGYDTKTVDPLLITSMSGMNAVKRVWHFVPYLVKGTHVPDSTVKSNGGVLEVTLGDEVGSKLFPCSGFVRGDLVGVIRAPAVHLTIMGKDVWAFMMYCDKTLSGDSALKFGKSTLSINHASSNATAELRADDADRRKLVATLNFTGTDFKKLSVRLAHATPSGDELELTLGEFNKSDLSPKQVSWTPGNRTGPELLWVFPTSMQGHHGALKDAIQILGAKVNRSVFADGYGRRQMDDFILADDERMDYQIKLLMEHNFELRGPTRGYLLEDSTSMKYVRKAARKKGMSTPAATAIAQPQLSNAALTSENLETKICNRCSSKIPQTARFCTHCGQMQGDLVS